MSGVKWIVVVDNKRECYRILTDGPVMEHDGVKERQWIADVFEQSDAIAITNSHNAALEKVEENGSSHNNESAPSLCASCSNMGCATPGARHMPGTVVSACPEWLA